MEKLIYEDGRDVELGDVVRLIDGSLARVGGVANIGGTWYVCGAETAGKGAPRGFVEVASPMGDPAADDLDQIQADLALTPDAYCKRRLLEVDGMKADDKRIAMAEDLLARQRAVMSQGA